MAIRAELEHTEDHPNPRVVRYPGPHPCLEFTFLLRQHTRSQLITFVSYRAGVLFQSGSQQAVSIGDATLATLRPFQSSLTPDNNSRWTLLVPTDMDTLAVIEEARRRAEDGAVGFTFDWQISSLLVRQGTGAFTSTVVETVEPAPRVTVPRDDWLKLLDQLEWDKRKVIEIRFPAGQLERWREAVAHLRAAENAFRNGIDNNSLQECENALERVSEQAGPQFATALVSQVSQLIPDAQKSQVVSQLVESAVSFVRRGKHLVGSPGTAAFDVDGKDAELAILLTKGLLVYLSKLRGSGN